MGDFRVKPIENDQQRRSFYENAIADLEAFEMMLNEGLIDKQSETIGAEQELCIIDACGNPSTQAISILNQINHPSYTNELALFNAEINLDPQKLTGDCFQKTEKELQGLLKLGKEVANQHNTDFFLTGILPTLKFRDLRFENMTPEPRYRILSEELLRLRGRDFEVYMQGVDDFNTSLKTVLFEACNTSFQLHLQINPDEFADMFNWSQMIAGPILSIATNSPLLFGKELWAENRIALFKQSLDTRGQRNHGIRRMSRVYFGVEWLNNSASDIWRKELIRFPLIFRGTGEEHPLASLKKGIMPNLRSIRLHNGTTYTWNRLCYGVHQNIPHLRIECRYLPAGPTIIDEMANFALWIGVMKGQPEAYQQFWKKVDFAEAKANFVKAARTGLDTVFDWMGKKISAKRLLLEEIIPMAYDGLRIMNVSEHDISYYLDVIQKRVEKNTTGSDWTVRNYRKIRKKYKSSRACEIITLLMREYQEDNIPLHQWDDFNSYHFCVPMRVEDLMNRSVITVKENVSALLALKTMEWIHVSHLPVEDNVGKMIGMVSKSQMQKYDDLKDMLVKDFMVSELLTCSPGCNLEKAWKMMKTNNVRSLLIVENNHLIGIITDKDLLLAFENKKTGKPKKRKRVML